MMPSLESLNTTTMLSTTLNLSAHSQNSYTASTTHFQSNEDLTPEDGTYKYLPNQSQYQSSSEPMKDFYPFIHPGMQTPFQRFQQMPLPHDFSHYTASRYFDNEIGKIPLEYARVWLDHQSLWRRFSVSGNEMIITKMGRRMFPVLSFGVHSLNFNELYSMEVEIVPSDTNRYKYVSVTGWRVNGVASQQEGNKRMFHPEGVQTGEYWTRNGVAFKKIKLTNKKTAKEGSNHVVLNSMHKYHIQLVVKQHGIDDQVIDTKKFEFKETEFIAVTAYQNDDVTQLKIDHNPFAKAFRDNNGDLCDRSQLYDMFGSNPKRRKVEDFDMLNPYLTSLYSNSSNNNNNTNTSNNNNNTILPPSNYTQETGFKSADVYSFSLPTTEMSQETKEESSRDFSSFSNLYNMTSSTDLTPPPPPLNHSNEVSNGTPYTFNTPWLHGLEEDSTSIDENGNETRKISIKDFPPLINISDGSIITKRQSDSTTMAMKMLHEQSGIYNNKKNFEERCETGKGDYTNIISRM